MGKENILKTLYENISSPAGYSGATNLLKYGQAKKSTITKQDVDAFLKKQDGFTRHGFIPKSFMRRPIKVPCPGHILGSDLIDMGDKLKKHNKGYRYILVLIDCFSRKVYLAPLKNKRNQTTAKAIEQFLSQTKHRYSLFFSDLGSEYKGRFTSALFEKYNIKQYSVHNTRTKCSLAERVIKSLKGKIFRRFTQLRTNDYITILPDLQNTYNSSQHRGLCNLTPNLVDNMTDKTDIEQQRKCQMEQKMKNYGSIKKRNREIMVSQRQILEPGTHVRILLNSAEGVFSKSYKPLFSEEIFKIARVYRENPITYDLVDLEDDPIIGRLYRKELRKTSLPEYFVIEKILKTRTKNNRKQVFVKWRSYPDKSNSWVDYKSVKTMKK